MFQHSSASLADGCWHIFLDDWSDHDIETASRVFSSNPRSQSRLSRLSKKFLFLLALTTYFLFISLWAMVVAGVVYKLVPERLQVLLGEYTFVVLFLLITVFLSSLFPLVFRLKRSRDGRPGSRPLRQSVDATLICSEIKGCRSEFQWRHISRLIDHDDCLIAVHESERFYLAIPKRPFGAQEVNDFVVFCRASMEAAQSPI